MRRISVFILALTAAQTFVCASEQLGPVHPIIEPDMLNEIYKSLAEKERTGETARLQKEAVERSKRSIENPRKIEGLTKVVNKRVFYWDPTVTVKNDIRSPDGKLIAAAGTRINPLDVVSLSSNLLFFDGTDTDQQRMALSIEKHHGGRVKLILVAGRPLELSRQWKMPVYFDQGSALVRKLGISRVPSMVSQEGKQLRIDELEMP